MLGVLCSMVGKYNVHHLIPFALSSDLCSVFLPLFRLWWDVNHTGGPQFSNYNLVLTDNSTYPKTTSDMVETHNEEAKDIIGNISSNNRLHISKLFHVRATLGTFYALPKLHKLSHLISINANRHMSDGKLVNTKQLIDKSNNLNIWPP